MSITPPSPERILFENAILGKNLISEQNFVLAESSYSTATKRTDFLFGDEYISTILGPLCPIETLPDHCNWRGVILPETEGLNKILHEYAKKYASHFVAGEGFAERGYDFVYGRDIYDSHKDDSNKINYPKPGYVHILIRGDLFEKIKDDLSKGLAR